MTTSTTVWVTTSTMALTTTTVSTTTNTRHSVGLYRVDAATLMPVPGTEPLTTGDWIRGELSPNGEWLAVEVWIDTQPETSLFQVIATATGDIVAELPGAEESYLIGVSDDGAVYSMHYPVHGPQLRKLALGSDELETVFNFPGEFTWWGLFALLDARRGAWLGTFGGDKEPATGIVVVDLVSGESTTQIIEDVTLGAVETTDLGDWSLSEVVQPAVVWDTPRDRALFVHGDEDKVTILDLDTAEVATHDFSPSASWLDRLFAWLIPPALAKGPSDYGVTRSAVLDPAGERLYVASLVSEVVVDEDGDWLIESTPRGVVAIDTRTWEVLTRWDIPAAEVALSPDGKYLVATGSTWTETLSTSVVRAEDVLVIDTTSNEPVGRFDAPATDLHIEVFDVQFSPDLRYLYVSPNHGFGQGYIVDLATMEITGMVPSAQQSFFADALLLARPRP